jgi:hypothetical protein
MKNKTLKTLVIFLTIGITQNACKKAETTTTSNYPDLTGCKVTVYSDATSETKISYNSNGTVSKIEEYEVGTLFNTNTYTYEPGKASYVNTSGREKGEYVLDSKGRATSSAIIYYQGQDPSTATSGIISTYKYNSAGNLVEKKEDYSSQSGTTSYLKTYQWTNGNMTTEIEVSSNNTSSVTNYEYYTDKSNAMSFTESAIEFTGVASKNLIKTSKEGKTGAVITSFSYEFNSAGKPTKIIFDEDGAKSELNLELTCP